MIPPRTLELYAQPAAMINTTSATAAAAVAVADVESRVGPFDPFSGTPSIA